MKSFYIPILILLYFGFGLHAQEKINWMSMEEALKAQKEKPRKILMDTYTDWCYPCKLMDKNTYGSTQVAEFINQHFYPVKFDAEGNELILYKEKLYGNTGYDPTRKGGRNSQHSFAQYLKIYGYPSTSFFDGEGDFIGTVPGYLKPPQLELYLKLMESDDYKTIESNKDMQEYRDHFKPTFTN